MDAGKKPQKRCFLIASKEDSFTLAWRVQVAKRSEADVPSGTNGNEIVDASIKDAVDVSNVMLSIRS